MLQKQMTLFIISLILLSALMIRIHHLTAQSFWFDEAFAWHIVIQADMFPRIAADTHPPLFYLLMRGWMPLVGDSELALRMLSVLLSTLTVAVMYPLGREIGRYLPCGRTFIPLVAMLLFALNDADIFHAQEARNYALYNLLGATSMWLYLRWIRTHRRITWAGWSICTALLVYTHYQGIFIPALQTLHILLALRGKIRLWALGGQILSGALLAPWMVLVTLPQAQNALEKGLPFAIPSDWETLLDLRGRFLGEMWVLVSGLVMLGAFTLSAKHRKLGLGGLLVAWVALPFAVLFIGNLYAPLLTDRKLLLITPALCLLIAVGISQLDRLGRGVVLVAIITYSIVTVDFYHEREAWRDIADASLRYADAQDLFLIEAEVGQYPLKYYITRHMPLGAQFHTFPFLADPTIAPVVDWYTYYDLFLPDVLAQAKLAQADAVSTAWVTFWSKDTTILNRLADAGYLRTWASAIDHLGSPISTYRYDYFAHPQTHFFANGMIVHHAKFDATRLRLDVWWRIEAPLSRDYTTAGGLLNADGILVAQWDSLPPHPTSAWSDDRVIYDPKALQVVDGQALVAGEYTIIVKVYIWDGAIEDIRTRDDAPYAIIGTVRLD